MSRRRAPRRSRPERKKGPSDGKLDEMIEKAIVDAYGESEEVVGFYTLLDEHLATPFQTQVLSVDVTVGRVDMTDDGQIVAVCCRGRVRHRVPILDLPLPSPPPKGADWSEAYRRWARVRLLARRTCTSTRCEPQRGAKRRWSSCSCVPKRSPGACGQSATRRVTELARAPNELGELRDDQT